MAFPTHRHCEPVQRAWQSRMALDFLGHDATWIATPPRAARNDEAREG
jgi:hypothetical protein